MKKGSNYRHLAIINNVNYQQTRTWNEKTRKHDRPFLFFIHAFAFAY